MRHFELEKYFSQWEFKARYHMTASDITSMSLQQLLDLATEEERLSFQQTWLGYTETFGSPEVRAEIARSYEHQTADTILCFAGAGEGIYTAARALLSPQDHVITLVPNYQSAETVPLQICQVSGVRLREELDWHVDMDELADAIRPTTRMVHINFPNNPTGTIMPRVQLDQLIELCRAQDIYLFSDEVYRGIEQEDADRLPQVADLYEKGLSLNVMSKAYGLPGLRIGWIACQDKDALQAMERYKHYLSICNSAPSEQLSLIALKYGETIMSANRRLVRRNLARLSSFLADYPELFSWSAPQGGCVGYVKYHGSEGVEQFCEQLIAKSGVLLLPSSMYRSDLMPAPTSHFRIGFGRRDIIEPGLAAMADHLSHRT